MSKQSILQNIEWEATRHVRLHFNLNKLTLSPLSGPVSKVFRPSVEDREVWTILKLNISKEYVCGNLSQFFNKENYLKLQDSISYIVILIFISKCFLDLVT